MNRSVIILAIIALICLGSTGTYLFVKANASQGDTSGNQPEHSAVDNGKHVMVERLVATDGALTEMIYALGYGDKVIAVDATAKWPASAAKKTNIGYVRNLSAEGILSVQPGLILNSPKAGPPTAIQQIKASKIPFVDIKDTHKDDVFANISSQVLQIGKALGCEAKSQELAEAIKKDVAAAKEVASKSSGEKETILFLFNHSGRFMASGKGSQAHAYIELAGFKNAAESVNGWKPFSAESLLNLNPDWIIVGTTEISREQVLETLEASGWKQTTAGKKDNLLVVDSLKFLGKGPRAGVMALELVSKLYPDQQVPQSSSKPWFDQIEKGQSVE